MSIWASVRAADPNILYAVPCRDEYTGDDIPDGPATLVDVATTIHDFVRLSMWADHSVEVILNADEVNELIERLRATVKT